LHRASPFMPCDTDMVLVFSRQLIGCSSLAIQDELESENGTESAFRGSAQY
jgi:hypothetical protein